LKNSKVLIAFICIMVLVFSFAACAQQKGKTENVTQVVTDENGEIVTGANGEALTEELEAQIVTDANGQAVTEVVTDKNGKPLTTVKDNKYVNVTQVVTQSKGGKQTTSTTAKSGSKTTSTTKSGKNKGKTTTTTTTTQKPASERKLTITVKLPTDSDVEDELTILVNGKEVKKDTVRMNGTSYTFTTKDKYKGVVDVTASLKAHGSSSAKTNEAGVTLEISYNGIPVLADDED
jgi:hypothetical protein